MHIKPVLTSFLGLLLSIPAFAQTKSVSVDNYTGSLNIAIPLYNVTSGSLSMPVTAVYQTSGVKVKDIKGELGMNWHLVAGGEVSRQVRGLPDDIKKDDLSNARLGWLYNTNGTKINAFTIANDNNTAVCTDETADNNYITTNFSDLSDTEPDVFNVNAPGLSCQFVFDNGHIIKTIPYQDLRITYNTDAITGAITSFTVVNDKDVIYTFSMQEQETRKVINAGTVSYFKRTYDQYLNGITYSRTWKLTAMTNLSGGGIYSGGIYITYATGIKRMYSIPVSVIMPGSSLSATQYAIGVNFIPLFINKVTIGSIEDVASPILTFQSSGNLYQGVSGMGRYTYLSYDELNTPATDRAFLKQITVSGGGSIKTFKMDYSSLTHSDLSTPASINLPDSTSKQIDYWGYYNASGATSLVPQVYINPANAALERYRSIAPGSGASNYPYTIGGVARDASIIGALNGSLSKISSDDGDETSIEYELNSFYDNTANAVVNGGGIRVKKITAFDGVSAANNIITSYSYTDPATAASSGRAVNMPVYAFTTPYTGSGTLASQWTNSTVRSEIDLSTEDRSIVYKNVKVSRTGTGNIQYEYTVPGTNWDSSALPDWTPTTIYSGRISCGAATFAGNQTRNYPYAPNPNFGFERGLLKKMSTFNDAGQQTSEDSYTYQRSYATPTIITGFKFDNNTASARNYAKYSIYASTSELITQQTKKVFDLPALSTFQTSTTTYNYASTAHKLPTSTETTNSDGSITRNVIKYVKDYTTTLGSDSMANSLYRLKQQNINSPIEQYQQVQRGANTVTTGASLTRYQYFDSFANNVKPSQSLQLVSPDGLANFQPSSIVSNVFKNDSRYIIKSNYLAYDLFGVLQSVDDNRHHVVTTLTSFTQNLPFVLIDNALVKEIAFNDFNSLYAYTKTGFTYTDTTRSTNDRNGQYAITIKPTSNIRDSITKSGVANNYIFSIWVNTTTTSNIAIQVTDGTHTNNVSLAILNTSGKWKYQEIKVPVGNLNATFTVKLTPSINTLIDDVLFYPENTQVNTVAYNTSYQKASETNSNGVSVYYNYDNYGRLRYVYDQDKNIVKKNTYVKAGSTGEFETFSISISEADNYNNPVNFSTNISTNITLDGLTYTWDFGDGSPTVTTVNTYTTHTYTHAGTFTVTLTKSSPVYGTKTATSSVTIAAGSTYRSTEVHGSSTTGATIVEYTFSQGGVFKYLFTQAQIEAGTSTVLQGVYDVTVTVNGTLYNPTTHSGYKSVAFGSSPINSPGNRCSGYVVGSHNLSTYTFNGIDLNGMAIMYFIASTDDCAPEE